MEKRTLKRGLALTELGAGVAQFGNLNRETTDEESAAAVNAAWDSGIRYFDTAPHYGLGLSERRLGAALRDRPRDAYVLSTKVGRLLVPSPETAGSLDDGFIVPADHRREWDFSRDGIRRSIEQSLKRLGLDRIDIAYLHDPDEHHDEAIEGMRALIEMRDEGLLGAVGLGMNQSAMPAEFVRRFDVDVVMIAGRYTLLEQPALADLLPLALERGVGVVAAAVYNSGLLSSDVVDPSASYNYRPAPPELVARAQRLAETCARHGITLPAAAVQFPLRHPAVVSVVVGTRTAAHVASTMSRYSADIPESLWTDLVSEGQVSAEAPGSFLS
jgi:D-threo-aldose 1-dehydrogenase